MRIIILDYVRKKIADKKFSETNRKLLFREIQRLSELVDLGEMELRNYMKKQNGKKLKGAERIPVFKYRLNDSDRLVYIYSKHLAWLADSEPEAVVIVDCIGHDEQAKWHTPPKKQNYTETKEMKELLEIEKNVKDLAEAVEEDVLDTNCLEIEFLAQEQVYGYFSEEHAAYVLTDEEFAVCDIRDLEVSLSKKQEEAIQEYQKNPMPTLILGGAGSGKTVMAIHMLYNYLRTHPGSKCIYFTQSNSLKRQSEDKLRRIFKNVSLKQSSVVYPEANVKFMNINTYCCERLGWKEENLVKLDGFQTFIEESGKGIRDFLRKKNINSYDLWAEIRGTIKGGMDQEWHRCGWFCQQDFAFPVGFVKELEKRNMIERSRKNLKMFRFTDAVMHGEEPAVQTLSKESQRCLQSLLVKANGVDPVMKMMDFESYMRLSGEESTLEREKREELYRVCETYQKWLGDQRYDENDLILKMFEQKEERREQYDLVIVDEVQDYTELQIYFLTRLAANVKGIILAGDQQQIINPTIFSESRIKTLFQNHLRVASLSRNFRCQEKVVAYANAISSLRNTYIGKGNQKEEEYSERKGTEPIRMKYSASEIKKLLEFIAPYPNIAVLVPDFSVKEKLKNLIGSEVYNNYDNDFIHTVSEIKGMEYQYVICYNLVGYYQKEWQGIMKLGAAKKNTRYRYYFNLIYVGVSRAQETLCLIDETENLQYEKEIEEQLSYKICRLERFDEKRMVLDSLNNTEEDWLLQARREKEAGLYQKAIQSYRHAAVSSEEVWECMLCYCEEEQKYSEALKYAVLLKEREQIERLLQKVDKKQPIAKLAELWINPDLFSRKQHFGKSSVLQWIDTCFVKSDTNQEEYHQEEWQGRLLLQYTSLLTEIAGNRIRQIQSVMREE